MKLLAPELKTLAVIEALLFGVEVELFGAKHRCGPTGQLQMQMGRAGDWKDLERWVASPQGLEGLSKWATQKSEAEIAAIRDKACQAKGALLRERLEARRLPEEGRDTHTEHCCEMHGCKYGETTCPVVLGVKPQSFPCETCMWDVGDF